MYIIICNFFQSVFTSPGGTAFERERHVPDWILDTWHPDDKERFPDYFERREKRKEEYIKLYQSDFGRNKPEWYIFSILC